MFKLASAIFSKTMFKSKCWFQSALILATANRMYSVPLLFLQTHFLIVWRRQHTIEQLLTWFDILIINWRSDFEKTCNRRNRWIYAPSVNKNKEEIEKRTGATKGLFKRERERRRTNNIKKKHAHNTLGHTFTMKERGRGETMTRK